MKTKQEIKNQKDQAKDPIIINLLKVILGEIDRLPTREEPTEEQIYNIIKKMYESAKIMSSYDNLFLEVNISIKSPKAIRNIIATPRNMLLK